MTSDSNNTHKVYKSKGSKIPFRCSSVERRNVCKFIVRFLFRNYDKDDLKKSYLEHGLNLGDNPGLINSIEAGKKSERYKGEKSIKLDYKSYLDVFLNSPKLKILIKCIMEYLLKILMEKDKIFIKEKNMINSSTNLTIYEKSNDSKSKGIQI